MQKIAYFRYGHNAYPPRVSITFCKHPYGMLMDGRSYSSSDYRFGFNGMEKITELNANGSSLDFGARIYDGRIARWMSVDPLSDFYPSYSPFSFCINNPLIYKDCDGKDVYIVIYTGGGNGNFKNAALTREQEIKNNDNYNEKTDHVYVIYVADLGTVKEQIENSVKDANSKGFGQTVEFSIYSHGGIDGPVGDVESGSTNNQKERSLAFETKKSIDDFQINKTAWKDIKFNFKSQSSIANFYGCNESSFAYWFSQNQSSTFTSSGQGGMSASESPYFYDSPVLGSWGIRDDVWFVSFSYDLDDETKDYFPIELNIYNKSGSAEKHNIVTNASVSSTGELSGISSIQKTNLPKKKETIEQDNTGTGGGKGNRGY